MDSPFSHIFDTNYIPTSEECTEINRLLAIPRLLLQSIDEQINDVQAKLETLFSERNRIAEVIDKHTAILSPIRRLPDDLLGEVFLRTLPEAEIAGSMSHADSPMALTRICSKWRQIAFQTPALWTSLYVDIPMNTTHRPFFPYSPVNLEYDLEEATEVVHSRIRGIVDWLSRSGALPLTIKLSCLEGSLEPEIEEESFVSQVIATILPHLSRLQEFSCDPVGPSLASLFTLPPSSFPILRSFIVRISSWDLSEQLWAKIQDCNLLLAGNLRTIGLAGVPAVPSSPTTKIPWSQLLNLNLEISYNSRIQPPPSVGNLLACLNQCVNLVNLRIDISQDVLRVDSNLSTVTIILPNVRSLHISDANAVSSLLPLLNFPVLEHLDYSRRSNFDDNVPPIEILSLHTLLAASNNIQSLILDPELLPPSTLVACLSQCPFIRTLGLRAKQDPFSWYTGPSIQRSRFLNSEFLKLLSGKVGEPGLRLCEQLEEFVCAYIIPVTERDVLDFLKYKQRSAIPLCRLFIKVELNAPSDPKVAEEIKSYFETGVSRKIRVEFVPARPKFPLSSAALRRSIRGEEWFGRHEVRIDGEQ